MEETKRYTMDELDEMEEFQDDGDDYEDYDDEPEDAAPEEFHDGLPKDEPDHIATFDEIMASDDTADEKFYVPEWKSWILVKGLTKNEFDHMRRQSRSKAAAGRQNEVLERELTIAGVVQPRLDMNKYNLLLERNAGAMVRILNKVMEKSGLGDDAETSRERRFPRKR